jgi:hypothetical protein
MLENHKADPGDNKTIYNPVEKIGRGANIYLGVESGKIETRRTQHTVHKGRIRKLGFAEINKIDLLDFFHPPKFLAVFYPKWYNNSIFCCIAVIEEYQ